MPWWKPSEEIRGDLMAIAGGLDNPQRICKERGRGDFKENVRQTLKAIKYAQDKPPSTSSVEGFRLTFDPGPEAAAAGRRRRGGAKWQIASAARSSTTGPRASRPFRRTPSASTSAVASSPRAKDQVGGDRPISMLARTAKPIEHWYFGKVVHDMAGMALAAPTLPIDYCHDPEEVLGFLDQVRCRATKG
jgi:hypothetical protein